ncbi:MAG: transcription termination/antitermination protein NusA [Muribaculaceae bacterium]|nr:transcription termination/antitermination protein NusA [Muribaculaceae bacterium]MDD6025007.1 transcription termination factor NusA [bacterium]
MAKKEVAVDLTGEFQQFLEDKGIDQATTITVLEESFRSVIAKMFGSDENFDVIVNPNKGDCEIYKNLVVVPDGEVQDPNKEIALSDALKEDPGCEVGEDLAVLIDFTKFGRRAILNLRQTLASKILDLQKDRVYSKFKDMEGHLVTAEVYQLWKKEILLVDADNNELILPKDQQIPKDFYRKGDQVRAIVYNVDNKNNNPKVYVSRTSEEFLRRLFENEVPEVHDGIISIKAIARIPGERAKIAVESYDERIDAVGACVGVKGSRIHGIVRELKNENIDVIDYTTNTSLFIQRALSPAKISSMRVDENTKHAEVFLHPEEVSLAIGKGGMNIRLASKLTGYVIDVYRESDDPDDIYLDEFSDEIDEWVIEALKRLGYTTAKAVLKADRDRLAEEADLEEDTVNNLIKVLQAEYED